MTIRRQNYLPGNCRDDCVPSPRTTKLRESLLGLTLVIAIGNNPLIAQNNPLLTREHQLKAAFLFNFTKFIQWPCEKGCDPGSLFKFCIVGITPLTAALERIIVDKTVAGRKPRIRHILTPEHPYKDGVFDCQVMFISQSARWSLTDLLDEVAGHSILTVGETEHFASLGGMIEFILINNKLRFAINTGAAQGAGLNISSQLLKLAITVGDWSRK